MHYLYFVLLDDVKGIDNSRDAIAKAESFLLENSFVGTGMFGGGKCDWFSMGGRWSGILSNITWGKEVTDKIKKLEEEKGIALRGGFYLDGSKKKKAQEELLEKAEGMWAEAIEKTGLSEYKGLKLFRKSGSPENDDAMKVTPELIKGLKGFYDREIEICDMAESEEILDSDLGDEHLGRWLVVVDYHE